MLSDETVLSVAEAIYLSMTDIKGGWQKLRADGAPSPSADVISKCRKASESAITAVLASKEVLALVGAAKPFAPGNEGYDAHAEAKLRLALAPFLVDSGENVG